MLNAAKRELFEETGALDFDIQPLCDYALAGYFKGKDVTGNSQVFFANIRILGDLPAHSEMEHVRLFDSPPSELTYPTLTHELLPLAIQKKESLGL